MRAIIRLIYCAAYLTLSLTGTQAKAQDGRFRVIAFYSLGMEKDHMDFTFDAISFFRSLAVSDSFVFDTTSDWSNLNEVFLQRYKICIWLNDFPRTSAQRKSFEKYMSGGGGWMGFHVSGYNDRDTNWPWFVEFMGGAVFYSNNWPPLPARLVVDLPSHPVARRLPGAFKAPANEWYIWKPSPRLNKDVQVIVSVDSADYPLGIKDVIRSGDLPVVWTNRKYNMLYLNMGHGDKIFTDTLQNRMFEDALLWTGARK